MWKVDIAKISIAVKKMLHRRCLTGFWMYQGSKYVSGTEYARVLSIPSVPNMQEFYIYQFLNMLGLHSFLNMPEYA